MTRVLVFAVVLACSGRALAAASVGAEDTRSSGRAQGAGGDQSATLGSTAPAVLRLDLAGAVARALEVSPRLERLGAQERSADAQRRMAESERWPQADVGASYSRRSEVPELSISVPTGDTAKPVEKITVFPNIQDNYRLRAGVAWPVYTGGRVRSQVEATQLGLKVAQSDTLAARADLVLEVKSAYWSLVTALESGRVLEEAIRSLDGHLKDAQNRETVGMAARNEVLAVQVERDRAELESIRATASAELAEAHLQRLLDLVPETKIEPAEPLAAPPPEAQDVEALVAEALASRADRTSLVTRAAAAQAQIGVERGARRPQVALSANYVYANPNRDIVPSEVAWKDTWDAGVSVSMSLFDGGRRSASVARAQAQADAARELVRDLDRGLRLEITQRALELSTASCPPARGRAGPRVGAGEPSCGRRSVSGRGVAVVRAAGCRDRPRTCLSRSHRGAGRPAPGGGRPRPCGGALVSCSGRSHFRARRACRREAALRGRGAAERGHRGSGAW